MLQHKNVLIVHNGALGDFLCAWPGIYAIVRYFEQTGQAYNFWFAGKESSLHWLKPLGFSKAPSNFKNALDNLYIETQWPRVLEDVTVFWFGLKKPVCELENKNLINLPILDFKHFKHNIIADAYPAVLQNLFTMLKNKEIAFQPDFKEAWQGLFGKWGEKKSDDLCLQSPFNSLATPSSDFALNTSLQVGLIPGAGHLAKQWSMENFELLAKMLDEAGYDPVYLLGPVEQERNILPQKARAEYPSPPPVLAERMLNMRAVIACDAGPAHLAAMHGVPGVVLFGPTCAKTWAPAGLALVQPKVDNPKQFAPIVDDPKDIDANLPSNINLITPKQVMDAFLKLIK